MIATRAESTDRDLVEAVRAGDDCAFEELYRRYQPRIAAFVRRKVGDSARAEDIAQDVFFSALRRLRATDADIDFKPWVFQIASNAAIDHWRRTSRAEEISVDADEGMRQSDRVRLTGAAGPDSVLVDKERFEHLRGAFDELSDVHTRILVMREFEGLSYREIAERLDVSRGSVESTLFRARRRLESEYQDISEGRRCVAMRGVIARISEGVGGKREVGRLARHARRCHVCRRRARELGVDPLPRLSGLSKAAAFLPLPLVLRRGGGGHGLVSGLLPAGGQVGAAVSERAAALVAAAAIAGAGGIAIGGGEVFGGDREAERALGVEQRQTGSGKEAGTNGSPATRSDPRPGGAARGSDARGGGPRSASSGGRRSDQGGSNAADGAGAAGSTGTGRGGDAPGAGGDGVGLPGIPSVSPGSGGGAPNAPRADVPRLPEPPSPPSPDVPALPDAPSAPRVELPQAVEPPATLPADAPPVPVEPLPAPELPPVDPGAQLPTP
jgi:RNA polymerase sigma factor (sigma-70 family)